MRTHDNLDDTVENEDGLTFRQWYLKADEAMTALCGLDVDDLPDGDSWNSWNDGVSPAQYARDLFQQERADAEMFGGLL